MESQPQNPEFRINPENFYPCICAKSSKKMPMLTLPARLVFYIITLCTQAMKVLASMYNWAGWLDPSLLNNAFS